MEDDLAVAEKFTVLNHVVQDMVQPTCPVMLVATAITRNNFNRTIFAQCKFKNLSKQHIFSMAVEIYAVDILGGEKPLKFDYSHVGTDIADTFGSDVPIPLPDENTVSIKVRIEKIVFSDGSLWTDDLGEKFIPVPQRKQVSDIMDAILCSQYQKEIKKCTSYNIQYVPQKNGGFVFCGCGNIYLQGDRVCPRCGMSFEDQTHIQNPEVLSKCIADEVKLREEKQREQKERVERKIAAIKNHPVRVAASIIGICACAVVVSIIVNISQKSHIESIVNPLSANAINISGWSYSGNNVYTADITSDIEDPVVVALGTKDRLGIWKYVYLKNGTGMVRNEFEAEPDFTPSVMGYLTGEVLNNDSLTITKENDIHEYKSISSRSCTTYITFSLDTQQKQTGILLFDLYDSVNKKYIRDQTTTIINGEGIISQYISNLSYLYEKDDDIYTVTPKFFIPAEGLSDGQYKTVTNFYYIEDSDSELSGLGFSEWRGTQYFEIIDSDKTIDGLYNIGIYTDSDLHDLDDSQKTAGGYGKFIKAETYDTFSPYSDSYDDRPNHEIKLHAIIPVHQYGSSECGTLSNEEAIYLISSVFDEFDDLLGETNSTLSFFNDDKVESYDDAVDFRNMLGTLANDAFGIKIKMSSVNPPLEYENEWNEFVSCIENIYNMLEKLPNSITEDGDTYTISGEYIKESLADFETYAYKAIECVQKMQEIESGNKIENSKTDNNIEIEAML